MVPEDATTLVSKHSLPHLASEGTGTGTGARGGRGEVEDVRNSAGNSPYILSAQDLGLEDLLICTVWPWPHPARQMASDSMTPRLSSTMLACLLIFDPCIIIIHGLSSEGASVPLPGPRLPGFTAARRLLDNSENSEPRSPTSIRYRSASSAQLDHSDRQTCGNPPLASHIPHFPPTAMPNPCCSCKSLSLRRSAKC